MAGFWVRGEEDPDFISHTGLDKGDILEFDGYDDDKNHQGNIIGQILSSYAGQVDSQWFHINAVAVQDSIYKGWIKDKSRNPAWYHMCTTKLSKCEVEWQEQPEWAEHQMPRDLLYAINESEVRHIARWRKISHEGLRSGVVKWLTKGNTIGKVKLDLQYAPEQTRHFPSRTHPQIDDAGSGNDSAGSDIEVNVGYMHSDTFSHLFSTGLSPKANELRDSDMGAEKSFAQREAGSVEDKMSAFGLHTTEMAKNKLQRVGVSQEQIEANWAPWRKVCYKVARTPCFKVYVIACVVVNVIALSVVASYKRGEAPVAMVISDMCTVLFCLEILIRVGGSPGGLCRYGWLLWDTALVCADVTALLLVRGNIGQDLARLVASLMAIRLLRMLRLLRVLHILRPLKILLRALSKGVVNVASITVFMGIIWLVFAIFATSLIGEDLETSEDIGLRNVSKHFNTIGHSLVTALEATVGGVYWGRDIVEPLLSRPELRRKASGYAVLVFIFVSTFLLSNLVLGIYIRQVVGIARTVAKESENHTLFEGERGLKNLREVLSEADLDGDGYIGYSELKALCNIPKAMKCIGLKADEVRSLHSALVTDPSGRVPIGDLLFGILKLSGTSKTLDMFSIDYKQKRLLRDIAQLDRETAHDIGDLRCDIENVLVYTKKLEKHVGFVITDIEKAKQDLLAEIAREDEFHDEARRNLLNARAMEDSRRSIQHTTEMKAVESRLDALQAQITAAPQNSQLRALTATADGMEALRQAVRESLDIDLQPWLAKEFARIGFVG